MSVITKSTKVYVDFIFYKMTYYSPNFILQNHITKSVTSEAVKVDTYLCVNYYSG